MPLSKYLLLEVPGFDVDAVGVKMGSFLRLGAVPDASVVADQDSIWERAPSAGAVTSKRGAGEDLAARVLSFRDDERLCSDPIEQDGDALPSAAFVAAPDLHDRERIERQLAVAARRARYLQSILAAVHADPDGWLTSKVERWQALRSRVDELRADYDQAVAAHAGQSAKAGPFVPPEYCAPGYQHDDPEAPYSRYVPKDERRWYSQQLHTRGGVRDHTDGNRISTTRGDKVEVVQGNYRLVVLGRHDQPRDPAGNPVLPGWDVSGGHIDEHSVTSAEPPPGTGLAPSLGLRWTRRWHGNWQAVEETIKADTKSVTTGDTEDETYGHWMKSTVGSESPDRWHSPAECPGGVCRTNPRVVDMTWAEHVKSYTGSSSCPIPVMRDETWVDKMTTESHVETIDEATSVTGSMNTKTEVGSLRDDTACDEYLSNTSVSIMTDTTRCGMMTTINTTALKTDVTLGSLVSTTIGLSNDICLGLSGNLTISAALNVSAAASLSLFVGSRTDNTLAAAATLSMGGQKEFGLAIKSETNSGPTSELTLLAKTIALRVDVG